MPLLLLLLPATVLTSCKDQAKETGSQAETVNIPDKPVFTSHIAPIIFDNCSVCHRPGEAAPFSLLSYRDVAKRAKQIAEVTSSRFMPPWLPDPKANHFEGQRLLTEAEIEVIARWAEQGAPEGNPGDLPSQPEFPNGWQLGEPDLVITMEEAFNLPPDGEDVYRNFVIPIPLETAKYVKAMELRPGNPRVVHHAFLLVDSTHESRRLDETDPLPGFPGMDSGSGATSPSGHFISWQPGKRASFSPPGMSWRLAPGTDLVLQLHLQTTGKEEPVQSSVGFYFTDEPPTKIPYKVVLRSTDFEIPAGATDHVVETSYRLPVDVQVLGIIPHAHYLGKSLQGYATLPNGKKQWLLKIDDWDFNWQGDYRYTNPIFLPKGSLITQHFSYDNSTNNPLNPHDPPAKVSYGPQTTDEMAELWLQLLPLSSQDYTILNRDFGRRAIEESIQFYQRRIASDPLSAADHTKLGKAQLALGRRDEAVETITRAIELDPGEGEPHYLLGMFKVQNRDLTSAKKHFEDCLKYQPTHFGALNGMGMIALRQPNYPVALNYFSKAEQAAPEDDSVLYNLGLTLVRLERPKEAVPYLKRALAINPSKESAAKLLHQALTGQ